MFVCVFRCHRHQPGSIIVCCFVMQKASQARVPNCKNLNLTFTTTFQTGGLLHSHFIGYYIKITIYFNNNYFEQSDMRNDQTENSFACMVNLTDDGSKNILCPER